MVGVPSSKACITCLKRRKRVYNHSTYYVSRNYNTDINFQCDLRKPSCLQCERLGIECAGYVKERIFVNTTKQRSTVSYKHATTTITLPDTLARSASESRFIGNFWSAYLPNGRALSSGALQDTLGGWTNTIQELYPTDNTLKKAVLALCLASSGRAEGMQWMTEEGLRIYVSALQEMKVALKRQSKAKQDAILTTARVFSLHEVSPPP
jgi:hypothetical protein